jgi:hypothetical protein
VFGDHESSCIDRLSGVDLVGERTVVHRFIHGFIKSLHQINEGLVVALYELQAFRDPGCNVSAVDRHNTTEVDVLAGVDELLDMGPGGRQLKAVAYATTSGISARKPCFNLCARVRC